MEHFVSRRDESVLDVHHFGDLSRSEIPHYFIENFRGKVE